MSKKRARNSRNRGKSKAQFGRSPNVEPAKQYILIVVEGEETEYNYFKSFKTSLKLKTTTVEVVPGKGGDPLVIVETANKWRLRNKQQKQKGREVTYDKIYCVFDGDKPTEYKQALEQAKIYGIIPIPSIPCFEFWFLLHYQYTAKSFDKCKDVISELKKNWIQDYDKARDMYSVLEPRLDQAIANAERLDKYHLEEQQTQNIDCANPSTKVHQLVKYLQDQKALI
ncbi:MAG: RloB domain-containing protein [Moorea sp. SIO2I5]|nr:RloB domain-containing protein [Moorena sp. SIO2I5]